MRIIETQPNTQDAISLMEQYDQLMKKLLRLKECLLRLKRLAWEVKFCNT
ncbi:MAG: hypothetical protein ACERKZ_20965 [Lachnotalea sp.]